MWVSLPVKLGSDVLFLDLDRWTVCMYLQMIAPGYYQAECSEKKPCKEGMYCNVLYCEKCHKLNVACNSNEQCCEGMVCTFGRCEKKSKGDPGSVNIQLKAFKGEFLLHKFVNDDCHDWTGKRLQLVLITWLRFSLFCSHRKTSSFVSVAWEIIYNKNALTAVSGLLAWRLHREMRRRLILHETGLTR